MPRRRSQSVRRTALTLCLMGLAAPAAAQQPATAPLPPPLPLHSPVTPGVLPGQRVIEARPRPAAFQEARADDGFGTASVAAMKDFKKNSNNVQPVQREVTLEEPGSTLEGTIFAEPIAEDTTSFQPTRRQAVVNNDTGMMRFTLGNFTGESIGVEDDWLSVEGFGGFFTQEGNGFIFGDARLILSDYEHEGANLGAGYRQYVRSHDAVYGFNAYYDNRNTGVERFDQVGAGVEILREVMDFNANAYVPLGPRDKVVAVDQMAFIQGTEVFRRQHNQTSMLGFDLEMGARWPLIEGFVGRASGGFYHFQADGAEQVWGWKAGLGAYANNVGLTLDIQDDELFNTTVLFGVEIAWPSVNGWNLNTPSAKDRLTQSVDRLQNIVITETVSLAPVAVDGQQVNLFFVANDAIGDGTFDDPYNVNQLQADPALGNGDVIVLLDRNGTIDDGDLTLNAPKQRVLGSADGSGDLTVVFEDDSFVNLTGLGGRPTFANTLTVAPFALVSGFDINSSSGPALRAVNLTDNAFVSDVNILGAGLNEAGIELVNNNGLFTFQGGATGGQITADTGIRVEGGSGAVSIDGANITNVDRGLVVTNFDGSVTAANTLFTNVDQTGIELNGGTGLVAFFDGLSIGLTGANTTGIDANGFNGTFDVAGPTTIAGATNTGIDLAAGSGTFNFGFLNIQNDPSSTTGINSNGFGGNFNAGATSILDAGDTGVLVSGGTGVFEFASLGIGLAGTGNTGISLDNAGGTFRVIGPTVIEDAGVAGVNLNQGTVSAIFDDLFVIGGARGIAATNFGGNLAAGDTFLEQFTTEGISDSGSTGSFQFASLNLTGNGATNGINVTGSSAQFTVTGPTSISGVSDAGMSYTGANTGISSFADITITGPVDNGLLFDSFDGTFNSSGLTTITNANDQGISITNGSGTIGLTDLAISTDPAAPFGISTTDFDGTLSATGTTTISGQSTAGVNIVDGGATYNFGTLNVAAGGATGVNVSGLTGGFNVINDLIVDDAITGFSASISSANYDLASVSMTNITGTGVSFVDNSGSLAINGGSIDLTSAGARGVDVLFNSPSISLNGLSITSTEDGVFGFGYFADAGSITANNNTISLTGAGTTGIDVINSSFVSPTNLAGLNNTVTATTVSSFLDFGGGFNGTIEINGAPQP